MDRRDGKGLAELMAELGKLEGLQWMRILYAYPSYFSDELIDEIARNPKVRQSAFQSPLSHIKAFSPTQHILYHVREALDDVVRYIWSMWRSVGKAISPVIGGTSECCHRSARDIWQYAAGVQIHRHTPAAHVQPGAAGDESAGAGAHCGPAQEAQSAHTWPCPANHLHLRVPRCSSRPFMPLLAV